MRIAIITRERRWGIGTHIDGLKKYLVKRGVDVVVFEGRENIRTNFILKSRQFTKERFDLIHIQGTPFGAFKVTIPKVTTAHTLLKAEYQYDRRWSYLVGQYFEKKTLNSSERIISVNPMLTQELIHNYGIDKDRIRYIPNGIDPDEYDVTKRPRKDFVFSCGRNIKRKRLSDIEYACKQLNVPHVHVGNGKYISRQRLLTLYKEARCHVMSSEYETGALTIMEAMMNYCPVISTNIPTLQDYVIDGITAITYPVGDLQALMDRIVFLTEHPRAMDKMVEKGYNTVRKKFSWDVLAEQTLAVYEEVV